jgi:hypothetical protein
LSLLALLTTANVGRAALATITPVPVAVSVLPAAGVAALPLPPRKMQKTLHQEQITRQNERKRRAILSAQIGPAIPVNKSTIPQSTIGYLFG